MQRGVAYIVFSNWRTGDSGLDTFVRHIAPLFCNGRRDRELVEIPYREDDCRRPEPPSTTEPLHAPAGRGPREPSRIRLSLSYLRRLLHDLRLLWPLRAKFRHRMLVTNQFGCETLPIALRILAPLNPLMAVCHTHPPRPRGGPDAVRWRVEKLCYGAVDRIVYNSAAVREQWCKRLGVKKAKGDVIWYGIDAPETALPADYPTKPPGAVDFVCVSRFVPWKGQRELIKAFARAREKALDSEHRTSNIEHRTSKITPHFNVQCSMFDVQCSNPSPPPMRLILVGNGPTWRECIRYARELGLDPFVTDTPDIRANPAPSPSEKSVSAAAPAHPSPLPNHRIPESSNHRPHVFFLGRRPDGATYFNGADVAVQLSTEPEAFGIVLLEAMSLGKAVLASRIGGMPEVVADGETARLVDPCDTEGVTDAIMNLAVDRQKRERLGQAGHQRWRQGFTVARMQREYAAAFDAGIKPAVGEK